MYGIGEVAKMMNLSVPTLRYYDDVGLLININRDSKGNRIFDDNDIEALNLIRCLKDSGMKIKDIKYFMDLCRLGNKTLKDRLDFFKKQELVINNEIKKLEKSLNMIKFKQWYYKVSLDNNNEDYVKNILVKDMPKDIQKLYKNSHNN